MTMTIEKEEVIEDPVVLDEAIAKEANPATRLFLQERKLEALVKLYNEAYQGGDFTAAKKLDEEIDEAKALCANMARKICFDNCKSTPDPLLTAIQVLTYPVVTVKDKELEDGTPVRSCEPRNRQIDLLALHKYCGGIGVDKNWVHIGQQLNYLLTVRQAERVQKEDELDVFIKKIHDDYLMSNIAKQINLGKTPHSNTQLLKVFQTLLDAMFGGTVKATSHDVNYILDVYAKRDSKSKLTISCPTHKIFIGYIMDACHKIITERGYGVSYKTAKKD